MTELTPSKVWLWLWLLRMLVWEQLLRAQLVGGEHAEGQTLRDGVLLLLPKSLLLLLLVELRVMQRKTLRIGLLHQAANIEIIGRAIAPNPSADLLLLLDTHKLPSLELPLVLNRELQTTGLIRKTASTTNIAQPDSVVQVMGLTQAQ